MKKSSGQRFSLGGITGGGVPPLQEYPRGMKSEENDNAKKPVMNKIFKVDLRFNLITFHLLMKHLSPGSDM